MNTVALREPMTQCLGFAFDMEEVKSWPMWLCDFSVVQEAIDQGWIVEIRKEPFISRRGSSFIIYGLSSEGRAEFLRRLSTISNDRSNQKLGADYVGTKFYVLPPDKYVPHIQTDECGFDRTASHTEDTYVCTCGWRAAPHKGQQ